MFPLTPHASQVVNPVLTTLTQGQRFRKNIWQKLFPITVVDLVKGTYLVIGDEMHEIVAIKRSPSANVQRMDYGFSEGKTQVEERALQGQLPVSVMNQILRQQGLGPALLAQLTGIATNAQINLQIEYDAATIAQATATYSANHTEALSGSDRWDDDTSKPLATVLDAGEVIRSSEGEWPDTLVIGGAVFHKLLRHPEILKYAGRDSTRDLTANPVDVDDIRRYFRVKELAFGFRRAKVNGVWQDVWGKNAILAHVGDGDDLISRATMSSTIEAPGLVPGNTFGAGLRLRGFPEMYNPWFDPDNKNMQFPGETWDTPGVIEKDLGYLIRNVIS